MAQTSEEKRDRFKRMYPPRVEKLVDTMRLLENCTAKSNYEWDEDLVKRSWIEIAKRLQETAAAYDLKLDISLNGDQVHYIDTTDPIF